MCSPIPTRACGWTVAGTNGSAAIAGTGAAGTRQAIELARNAKEAGAAACLVVTPYFLHPSPKGIYQHFYDIATAVDVPIILYNIPQVVDAYLPRRVVEDLADIPNVVGLKDSSGNLTYTMEILEYAGDRIDVFVGHDEVVLPALAGAQTGLGHDWCWCVPHAAGWRALQVCWAAREPPGRPVPVPALEARSPDSAGSSPRSNTRTSVSP